MRGTPPTSMRPAKVREIDLRNLENMGFYRELYRAFIVLPVIAGRQT
jgi:hypothetical protein